MLSVLALCCGCGLAVDNRTPLEKKRAELLREAEISIAGSQQEIRRLEAIRRDKELEYEALNTPADDGVMRETLRSIDRDIHDHREIIKEFEQQRKVLSERQQ